MDNDNVISLTTNPDELKTDIQNWSAMPFDLRKKSDDACISKYGVTNIQLYDSLLSEINNANSIQENVSEDELAHRVEQLKKSMEIQDNSDNIIIDIWLDDSKPSYSLSDLEDKYNRYMSLATDIRDNSDAVSMSI